ncbi:uncharacterized protein LOC131695051, partial [Topomyia yanbarensis]|uniref:uncharacterized protein LOC131695051 n=1 Tax=Topomyia yanbarensis TaxID=2498891 RepID=UPI00273AD28B
MNISTASSSSSSNGGGSKQATVKQELAKKASTATAAVAAAKPRLVPSIAVSMKQKLRGTTETIKSDINRNRTSTSSSQTTVTPNSNGNDPLLNAANVLNSNGADSSVGNNNNKMTVFIDKNNQPANGDNGNAFFERAPLTGFEKKEPRAQLEWIGSLSSLDSPALLNSPRMRTSTMKSGVRNQFVFSNTAAAGGSAASTAATAAVAAAISFSKDTNGLSPVLSSAGVDKEGAVRDKSDKRKSNLNRSQHEEATEKRPSSAERQHRHKSGSTPLSSPELAKTRSRASPSSSSKSSRKSSSSSEKPSGGPVPIALSPSTTSATSTTASLRRQYSPLLLHQPTASRSLLQSPTPSLVSVATTRPVPSSVPSSPAKYSPRPDVSKSSSPVGPLKSSPHLLHSSSSNATPLPEDPTGLLPVASSSSRNSIRNRLDVRVDSRISSAGSEQDADVPPESPLVQQYSKFSQMLKSPTLEKYEITRRPSLRSASENDLEVLGQQDVPLDLVEPQEMPSEAVLLLLDDEANNASENAESAADIIVIGDEPELDLDLVEAGPSGLCPIVINDDDHVVEREEEVLSNRQALREIRSGSSSPTPVNRILFDDKFNDEFVVIENSPKSHFIQSLDETDIIVIGDNDEDYPPRPASSNSTGTGAYEKKLVKMSSVEHFESFRQRKSCSPLRKKSLSPIMRAKSMEENHLSSSGSSASNHIVSILKRKTVESNSSASSNASPVTFSPSVVDTPIRSNRRQGILKKRCSLDESRYSRSHSPDDRSILVKHTRRNSFEDGTQHGILKQKSYESKEDVSTTGGSTPAVNAVVSHGILKRKTDSSSTSTPNEQPKHVSISQAVILAAVEICQDMLLDNEHDHEIRPILKSDSQPLPTPKPILKKKYSSESEEIRPILKSSRKSSREENSDSEELKRSILKTDSPAKRRSFGDRSDSQDSTTVLIRSRSLEHPDPVPMAPVVPQVQTIEKPIISVAERIKHMEKFLSGPSSSGAVPKRSNSTSSNASSRRESYRFKTQPVTSTEIVGVQQQIDRSLEYPDDSNSSIESSCNREQTEPSSSVSEPLCPRGSLESLISKEKQPVEDKSGELLSPTLATAESNSHSISGEFNLASLSSDSGIQFGRGTEETSGADNVSSVKTSDSEKSPSKKTIDDDLNELEEEEEEEHLQIIEETEGQQRILLSPSIPTERSAEIPGNRRRVVPRNSSSSCSSTSSSGELSDRESEKMYKAPSGRSQHQQQHQREDLYTPVSDPDDDSTGRPRSNSVRARANMFQQMESRMKENECPSLRGRR